MTEYPNHLVNYKRVTAYIACAGFIAIAFALYLFLRVKRVSYVPARIFVPFPRSWPHATLLQA